MSLIQTVLVPEFAVQVSETRLSSSQGPPRDDQRKVLVFEGQRFRGLVGWVGLATANPNHNTGDWLVDQLRTLTAEPIPTVAAALAERATKHIATLWDENGEPVRAPTEFVLAGWAATPTGIDPVLVIVETYTTRQGHVAKAARDFRIRANSISKTRPVKRPCVISVSGQESAADDFRARFLGLKRRIRRGADTQTVRNICIDLLRLVAKRCGEERGPVGSSIIAVEMPRDGEAKATFYPWDRAQTPAQYHPDIVTPDMVFKRIEIWAGETPPPWWTP
jgi:hypothetical protein